MAVVSPVVAQHAGQIRYPNILSHMASTEIAEEPGVEDTIFVAVGKDVKESKSALIWAIQNSGGKKICLLHVHVPAQMIPMSEFANFLICVVCLCLLICLCLKICVCSLSLSLSLSVLVRLKQNLSMNLLVVTWTVIIETGLQSHDDELIQEYILVSLVLNSGHSDFVEIIDF